MKSLFEKGDPLLDRSPGPREAIGVSPFWRRVARMRDRVDRGRGLPGSGGESARVGVLLKGNPMPSLAQIIRERHAEILQRWTTEAQRAAAARGLNRPEFQNIIPTYLHALAEAGDELGRFTGKRREHVESHLSSRLRQGFQLAEIVEEFALLGRCIAATWNSDGTEPPHHTEIEKLFEELHLTSAAVTETFTRHMMEDEQAEKKYLRLIQTVAQEALQNDAPALRERLKEVLRLVMEAMGAQSAALLLLNSATNNLELVASAGAADEELAHYVTSLHPSSFAGTVAAQEETVADLDAATTDLKISDELRRSGIHSLLGVRLPPRHRLVGVMYVGLTETRPERVGGSSPSERS
jgi:hypothetical protein